MAGIPKFDSRDVEEIHKYLQEWDKHGIGDLPNGTTDSIFLVPLLLALLKNSEETKKLAEQILKELKNR